MVVSQTSGICMCSVLQIYMGYMLYKMSDENVYKNTRHYLDE